MRDYLVHVRDGWCARWDGTHWAAPEDSLYTMGWTEPNYPMPTIATGCVFFNSYVTLNRYNGNDGYYGPGYESVYIWERVNA